MRATPHPGAGIEISDVDLRTVDDATFDDISGLFADYGVAFFRDQELTEHRAEYAVREDGRITDEEPLGCAGTDCRSVGPDRGLQDVK